MKEQVSHLLAMEFHRARLDAMRAAIDDLIRHRPPSLLIDNPARLGTPTGFRIAINEVYGCAGAGFVVAKAGDIMTMPGLPKVPAAEGMALKPDGEIVGLS